MNVNMIPVVVKQLDGDLIALEVDPSKGLNGVASAFREFREFRQNCLLRVFFLDDNDTTLYPNVMLGVVVDIEYRLILNRTTSQYFVIPDDGDFDSILRNLMEPHPFSVDGLSHWMKDDHIVFVPPHLEGWVVFTYGRIDP